MINRLETVRKFGTMLLKNSIPYGAMKVRAYVNTYTTDTWFCIAYLLMHEG